MSYEVKIIGTDSISEGDDFRFSPADGEVWYVDQARFTHEGDANGDKVEAEAGVFPTSITISNLDNVDRGYLGVSLSTSFSDDGNVNTTTGNMGGYITSDQEVVFHMTTTNGATVTAAIQLRRVL